MDFIDDDGTDAGPGVGRAKRERFLGRILRLAGADHVTPKLTPFCAAPNCKIHRCTQVRFPPASADVEINFLAMRIEPETIGRIRVGVPIIIREDNIAPGRDGRARIVSRGCGISAGTTRESVRYQLPIFTLVELGL